MDIEKLLKDDRIFQYKIIPSQDIPFSQAVVAACQANACGKYGTCWTCPPGVGELSELENRIKAFPNAAVYSCKYDLEDCFDFEGMTEGAKATQSILYEIEEQLKSENVDFLALGCEGCHICDECTYPDAPCRFPEKATPSVEACGIDVVSLSRNIGIRYNNGTNTVTYFNVILFR